jgi:hypothetical protein
VAIVHSQDRGHEKRNGDQRRVDSRYFLVLLVPRYSWNKQAYASTTEAIAQVAAPTYEWGASFAAMSDGNPSPRGTFVGVIEKIFRFPVFALRFFGGSCRLGDGQPHLANQDLLTYEAKRASLQFSDELSSDACRKYFTDPSRADWNSDRANYSIEQVIAAVKGQDPFDGPKTTISQFDAGGFPAAALREPAAMAALQRNLGKAPVCGLFVTKMLPGGIRQFNHAFSQAAPSTKAPYPAKDVYVNTKPEAFQTMDEGTILHEALHNLTGRTDDTLADFVGLHLGPNDPVVDPKTGVNLITKALRDGGCVPR